ncbi:MAG: ATP-binding protein [Granulosicoccaceae bacterium]
MPLRRLSGQSRLFKTTSFRLAMVLIGVFSVLITLTMLYTQRALNDRIEMLVDTRLRLESDLMASLYESGSLPLLMSAIQKRNEIDEFGRFYYLANRLDTPSLAKEDKEARVASNKQIFYTMSIGELIKSVPAGTNPELPVRVVATKLDNSVSLYIAHEISNERALTNYARWLMIGAIAVALLFALAGGVWASLLVMRRVDGISRTTAEIIDGDLSRRLRVTEDGNEFDLLAARINLMLNRIEELMNGMREVTSNIAHDLRSPLTRLRNRLDVALLNEPAPEEYRSVLSDGIQDADSLINTFNALLSIARMEAGIQQERLSDVAIAEILSELEELYEPLAEDMNLRLSTQLDAAPVMRGDRHLLAQAFSNLLDNAFKYGATGGEITVTLRCGAHGSAEVVITDRGEGVPDAARERVFQRFVRLERERNSPGNGLGLSMVRAIVHMHHGAIRLEDNRPGLRVVITLPVLAQLPDANSVQSETIASH